MSQDKKNKPTNRRQMRRETDRKILYLVIFTLVVIGGLLIGVVYGPLSLVTAVPFLLIGAALILIPWFLLSGLERWLQWLDRRADPRHLPPPSDEK